MKAEPKFDEAMQKQADNAYQFALLMRGLPNTYNFDSIHWPVLAGFNSGPTDRRTPEQAE